MSVTYKSNVKAFKRAMKGRTKEALGEIGVAGTKQIKSETPVLTGELRDANDYEVEDELNMYFYNDKDYAPYVELGTYKQFSNPFMRRGILKSIKTFTRILVKKLKV